VTLSLVHVSLILFISLILICFLLRSFSLSVLLDLAMGHKNLRGTSAGDTGTQGIYVVTLLCSSPAALLLMRLSSSRAPSFSSI
jgi:hypothetical protein